MSSWGFFSWFKVYGRFNLNNTYSHCWILGRFKSQQRYYLRNCLSSLPCNLKVDGRRLAVHPGPPPKLLRNKEYEALWRAYWVDMLLLDPKAVVTATMVLERPDALDGSLRIIQIKLLRPSDSSCSDMHIHSFVMKGLAPDNSEPLLRWSHC
ncbi:hypothetical protein HID58_085585 [Brassica napus]|uniref:Uncharacterized protein n=2 Tax=Brassica napus TaxID=3708 RepID=A0ABQ7XPG1_BRANA|nr:hypothetical protein HID58_085585 [Brassica napus]